MLQFVVLSSLCSHHSVNRNRVRMIFVREDATDWRAAEIKAKKPPELARCTASNYTLEAFKNIMHRARASEQRRVSSLA